MNVSVAEYVPVLNAGLFKSVNVLCTEFGLVELHDPPPPVQTLAPSVTTLVGDAVETVCVPEQAAPKDAALHVYVSCPLVIEGPPAGLKSAVAFSVSDPDVVVRAL